MSKNDELDRSIPVDGKFETITMATMIISVILALVFALIMMVFGIRYSASGFNVNEFDFVLEGYEEEDIGAFGIFGYKEESHPRIIYTVNKDLNVEDYGEVTVVSDKSRATSIIGNNKEKITKINRLLDDGKKVRVQGSDTKVVKLGDRYILDLDGAKYLEYEEF